MDVANPTVDARHAARAGFTVVGITLLVGICLGIVSFVRYKQSVQSIEDLFTALACFLSENNGRFPASSEELLKSDFVQRNADGSFQLMPDAARERLRKPRPVYSARISSLDRFQIPWGIDLGTLAWEVDVGIMRDEKGHEALIIGDVSSVQARRQFTYELLQYRADLLGAQIPRWIRTGKTGHAESPASAQTKRG